MSIRERWRLLGFIATLELLRFEDVIVRSLYISVLVILGSSSSCCIPLYDIGYIGLPLLGTLLLRKVNCIFLLYRSKLMIITSLEFHDVIAPY